MDTNKDQSRFKFILPIMKTRVEVRKDIHGNETEVRFIEGKASSTDKDLHGDKMAPAAIKTMAESIKFHAVNLNADHDTTWSAEIGPIVKLDVTEENDLMIEAELSEMSKANDLWYALTKQNKKLGLSIGGYVKEYEMVKEEDDEVEEGEQPHWYRLYKDIDLDHVAVTSSPANPKTWVSAISKSIDKSQDQALIEKALEKEGSEEVEKSRRDSTIKDLARKIARSVQDIESNLLLELTESILKTLEPGTIAKIEDYVNNNLELELKEKKEIAMNKKDASLETTESLKKDDAAVESETPAETTVAPENETEETATTEVAVEEETTETPTEEATATEETPAEEKPVEEKPAESETTTEATEEAVVETEESTESTEEVKTDEEKPAETTEVEAPAAAEEAATAEVETEPEVKSVEAPNADLLKAVKDLNDGLKEVLKTNEALTKRVAELENEPAARKTVEITKELGDSEEESSDPEALLKERDEKIAQIRKDNYGNPNLFSMIQKVRAEYSSKI